MTPKRLRKDEVESLMDYLEDFIKAVVRNEIPDAVGNSLETVVIKRDILVGYLREVLGEE